MKPLFRKLLELGHPDWKRWDDYPALGIGLDDEEELIAVVSDPAFVLAAPDSVESWAALHAWRALGQLRSTRAIPALAGLLPLAQDDDWMLGDLPTVFGMIGSDALPALSAFVMDLAEGIFSRATAADGLSRVAQRHPEARDECVSILSAALERFEEHDPLLNSLLIGHLVDLQAVEAVPLIEGVFEAERIDLAHMGDWEDVQIALGLLSARTSPRPRLHPFGDAFWTTGRGPSDDVGVRREQQRDARKAQARKKQKAKQKRKAAGKSRRRNRR